MNIEYSKLLSWAENLNFLPKTVNNLFKFTAQDSDLEYSCWRRKKFSVSSDLKPLLAVFFENILIGWSLLGYTRNQLQFAYSTTDNCRTEEVVII